MLLRLQAYVPTQIELPGPGEVPLHVEGAAVATASALVSLLQHTA